ncbi:hypothetical protein N1F91_26075 [Aquibium sp. ELW1220]|nr:hypothetical protein [Aquibium sp. ELW1220]MDN2583455.1 hypothetical protein [Aquibium sp. ELW1220]
MPSRPRRPSSPGRCTSSRRRRVAPIAFEGDGRSTICSPTIIVVSRDGSRSAGRASAILRPPRMTVMRSEWSSASCSLWVTRMTARPASASPRTSPISTRPSASPSTAVGSSRITMRAPATSTLRISIRCCSAMPRSPTRCDSPTSKPMRPASSVACLAISADDRPGLNRQMFSSTEKARTSLKCWCTMPTPRAAASRAPDSRTLSPPISIRPSSGA